MLRDKVYACCTPGPEIESQLGSLRAQSVTVVVGIRHSFKSRKYHRLCRLAEIHNIDTKEEKMSDLFLEKKHKQ